MFYPILIRPILFRCDAEKAHHFALNRLTWLARQRRLGDWLHRFMAPRAADVTIGGLTFPNPVGLAGGMDKNAVATRAWWSLGFGFVELGTITPKPQPGNSGTRMWRLPKQRAVVNRMGFNNDGAEVVAARLADQKAAGLRPPFPVGISLGVNKRDGDVTVDDGLADYVLGAQQLAPQADFLTMNVSSPNTPGLRALQEPDAIRRMVAAVRGIIGTKLLLVKVAPELTGDALAAVVDAAMTSGANGLIGTNTLGTTSPTNLPAGLSGLPLRETALNRVAELRKRLGPGPVLIGCGGISDVPSARAMFEAGANLIQIYTALVYEGPLLAARIARGLRRI